MKLNFSGILLAALLFVITPTAQASLTTGLPAASYTASSTYLTNTAQSAFNGGTWTAPAFGNQWIQAALSTAASIYSVTWVTNQAPNGIASLSVYIANTSIGSNWVALTPIATFSQFTANGTFQTLNFAPTTGQFITLVANGGPSWTALSNVNVYAVPEPTGIALFALGLGLLGFFAYRRNTGSAQ